MDIKGKKVLVIGLARSGMAAIRLLKKLGAQVTLSESKPAGEIKELSLLQELGVEVCGQEMAVFEREYDLCVKNPGVPYRAPFILKLEEKGVPVTGGSKAKRMCAGISGSRCVKLCWRKTCWKRRGTISPWKYPTSSWSI